MNETILVVDDEREIADLLEIYLKNDGYTVHTYNDGDLIACFEANIPESVVKEIAQRKPLRAVFRDSGFASSPEKINVFEIFKLYMPEDANDISKRVRVI